MKSRGDVRFSMNTPYAPIGETERIRILLEEYRALYALLTFRLGAIDRRLPVAGGTVAALLGGVLALPSDAKGVALLATPALILWLFRTTAAHSRSKEDVLRRIDEIERHVNRIAGEELLAFQSQHPNQGRLVGGRSGIGSVLAVLSICVSSLSACVFLAGRAFETTTWVFAGYAAYVGLAMADITRCSLALVQYRYRRARTDRGTVFAAFSSDRAIR